MLAGRAGEIVSRRETPSQCGRVRSPAITLAVGKLVNFCDHKAITRMFIGKHATNFSMGKCLIRC